MLEISTESPLIVLSLSKRKADLEPLGLPLKKKEGGPVVKTVYFNAGGGGSILGLGTRSHMLHSAVKRKENVGVLTPRTSECDLIWK